MVVNRIKRPERQQWPDTFEAAPQVRLVAAAGPGGHWTCGLGDRGHLDVAAPADQPDRSVFGKPKSGRESLCRGADPLPWSQHPDRRRRGYVRVISPRRPEPAAALNDKHCHTGWCPPACDVGRHPTTPSIGGSRLYGARVLGAARRIKHLTTVAIDPADVRSRCGHWCRCESHRQCGAGCPRVAGYAVVRRSRAATGRVEQTAAAIGRALDRRVPQWHPRTGSAGFSLALAECWHRQQAVASRNLPQARDSEDRMRQFITDARRHETAYPVDHYPRLRGAVPTREPPATWAACCCRGLRASGRMGLLVAVLLLARPDAPHYVGVCRWTC